ncbi:methyltransferase domain-containing protein [Alteromonas pelagimontana]|uniref:Methyltransferase domain-containing protein n=1 Tax=Alteromonas pelagimontana TaxID=1858656 RepID=A0A6M4MGX6_9ALTE|nr:methyltransferase domain-containing protein [Alteromonas pelagimontana]QJR81850.1 methyltransferase domain-containing protein [Alteromonas pelagimontana]
MVITMLYTIPPRGYQGIFEIFRHWLRPKYFQCLFSERYRSQPAAHLKALAQVNSKVKPLLHFAQKPNLQKTFKLSFNVYETANLLQRTIEHQVDLRNLPLADESFDVVSRSQIFEHNRDDYSAIQKFHRVSNSACFEVLAAPVVGLKTIGFEPAAEQNILVRFQRLEYFERYKNFPNLDVRPFNQLAAKDLPFSYAKITTHSCQKRTLDDLFTSLIRNSPVFSLIASFQNGMFIPSILCFFGV